MALLVDLAGLGILTAPVCLLLLAAVVAPTALAESDAVGRDS